jgi:hypothetical protein
MGEQHAERATSFKLIIVDTGAGSILSSIIGYQPNILNSLAKADYKPHQINVILIRHGHYGSFRWFARRESHIDLPECDCIHFQAQVRILDVRGKQGECAREIRDIF